MMRQTGCDGVMIARGAQGNPWIFSELTTYEETGMHPPRPSVAEVQEMILRHARLQVDHKGELAGIREMRKHMAWYTKGIRGAAKFRGETNVVSTYAELEKMVAKLAELGD